ncbi:MAG: PadR family transcriptional regulator [Psychrobacillus psychrodurans]
MTRLMVLGLLKTKPMSGYEIQQTLQISEADRWAGILAGSIYHALKKMEKEQLVEVEAIEQTGNRSKAIYKITENGVREFQKLLKDTLEELSVNLPSNLYTALSFIQNLPSEDVLQALSKQKLSLEHELEIQKKGIQIKKEHMKIDEVTELIFQNMYSQYDLQIQLLKKLIDIYELENK